MNRRLATPGALLMFAGAFLLYWGLREFGIIGETSAEAVAEAANISPTPSPIRSI